MFLAPKEEVWTEVEVHKSSDRGESYSSNYTEEHHLYLNLIWIIIIWTSRQCYLVVLGLGHSLSEKRLKWQTRRMWNSPPSTDTSKIHLEVEKFSLKAN